jgi:hypothetical protein
VRCRTPLLVALSLASCASPGKPAEQEWTPSPSADLGNVVARVGQVPILARQVEAEAKRAGKPLADAAKDLIASYLLAEQARLHGYRPVGVSDPDVQSALVQRLLERELEPSLRPEDVPDSDLRPFYERAREHFVHARFVEIGLLAIYTGAGMQKEDREPREQTARELALYLKKHPPKTLDEFATIASDPTWSGRSVEFKRFFQSADRPLAKAVGDEVAKLHAPGDTTPLVVDEDGAFIARYISDRPAEHVTFEETRGKLLWGTYDQWRHKKFLDFTNNLARRHRVELFPDRLPRDEQGP